MGTSVVNTPWGVMAILLPLVGALVCFLWPRRSVPLGLVTAIGVATCVAGLGWQVVVLGTQRYAVGGWGAPLGIDLYADGLSLLMLMVTAGVGLGISAYSTGYFERKSSALFWPLWLFLWAALNALFLSADIFNLYVTLELLGLAAVALVALAGGADALTSAMRYLLVSLLGSLFYLLGVALLYHSFGSVDIAILAQRMEPSPTVWAAVGLMSAGLLLKTALFPLHFWLPPAHASAPAPVSALLSALVVKASFYILLRLWLEVFPLGNVAFGQLLGLLGAAAVLWGGIQALRQTRLKLLIAYSTVAQLGYFFLAFPLETGTAWKGSLYLLLSHALAKAAMFMAAGNIMRFGEHDRIADLDRVAHRLPLTVTAFALAGISIIGLPPSGGFIGKWLLLDAALRAGQWWWVVILILGGLLAAAYIFKVIGYAFTQAGVLHETRAVSTIMELVALALALGAILLGLCAPWPLALMEIGLPFGRESAG
ncbi:MAG: oxidoreductase [Gammaproteobacteria bacterium (ex Lamellibrachia satsuma)]|nr:MAG: oxidoreductase [Gammaproteobacteria bacterium (ex Lamellibrachia satsuma)]RRS37008.1 MAG: oxidoreductase [Gammaproteobacteria bacterium (ex Lamellibrachia satsuma)]